MALAGKDFKIQVNGTSGNWNEVQLASDASSSISAELLDVTHVGDEALRRIQGVVDAGIDFEFFNENSPSEAVTDLEDAALNGTEISVEFSPDGNASSGPTDVYDFEVKVASYEYSPEATGTQPTSVTLENSDGNVVGVSGSFST